MEQLFNPVQSRSLILDVGANNGKDGLNLALENPTQHVIAFEPVPEMIHAISIAFNDLNAKNPLKNYTLVNCAVSDFNGKASFNVAGQADWGCSSLNSFAEHLNATWPGRTDFKVTHQIEVDVIRLDSFLAEVDCEQITYLHCDTQGTDLSVLRGLGVYRERLKEGVIECASSKSVALYKNQHLLEDAIFEFMRWNYEIVRITANDIQYNEVNVRFRNRLLRINCP